MLIHRVASEVINRPPRKAYLNNLIYEDQLAMIHGPGGSGKSYVTVGMAACIATGTALGPHIQADRPLPVAYLQSEGSEEDYAERIEPMYLNNPALQNLIDTNLHWIDVVPLNLADYRDKGVAEIIEFVKKYDIKVIFYDSLYSSLKGSMTSDETAMAFFQTVKWIRSKVDNGLAMVGLHHDHRPKRNADGDIIDEGSGSFFGSAFWFNSADQFWKWMRKPDQQNGKFVQTKTRSRYQEVGDFHVIFDKKTGLWYTSSRSEDELDVAVRTWIYGTEGRIFTTAEFKEGLKALDMAERTLYRTLDRLVDDGTITKQGRGKYKWTQS